jgi:uncharacterized protein with HEPN domain
MPRQDDASRLRHMLNHAVEAVEMSRPRKREDLDADRQLNLALVRLVEIIGEAATRISDQTRGRDKSIPWDAIRSMRHRLIHGYDEVDFDILWDVVRSDLPELIPKLRALLSQ